MTLLRLIAAAAIACIALPVQATFHLWTMTELYSSADGTVQFLELSANAGGQQFLSGHSLEATSPTGVTHTFVFTNLPGDTSGKTMLVGTQGFAALGIVQPDFVVPNGFFFQGGGTIVFGDGADSWQHGALPNDGRSLLRNGQLATNSPRNFAGQTGTVSTSTPAVPPFNVHGLWGKDDEAGWGVNLAQHGNIIFLTWFTYDLDATPTWFVMSSMTLTGSNTWSGDIYRTTAVPFDSFNPGAPFQVETVGNGSLTFTDTMHGTFAYRIGSVQQSKPITRYVFGPVPQCDQTGAVATNFTDLWGKADEAGWGVNLVQQGDLLFLTWFTYGADSKPMWLVGSGLQRTSASTFTGDLYRTTGSSYAAYDVSRFTAPKAGDATVTFTSASTGTFRYTVGTTTQTKQIARNVHASPATTCR